jgi:bis(5'-nucleosyl)-tetraphosphatase (symmetrical)
VTTWAIGDVQGCATTLERLLARIRFDPGCDRLVFCGDLVNRGARSLDTLRLVRGLGRSAESVLGNHDLHLLSRALGVSGPKRLDTLADVLAAPDRDELLEWLLSRPLLHRENGFVVVHAGLHPAWDVPCAEGLAREAETALRGDAADFLTRVAKEAPDRWDVGGAPEARCLFAVRVLTRVRVVREDGRLCAGFGGAPVEAPQGCVPWFAAKERKSADANLVFGHWSALKLHVAPGLFGLDTGCVWGGLLTALDLETLTIEQEPQAAEDRATW